MGTLLAVFFMLEQGTFRFPSVFLIFITYFSGYLYTKYQHTPFFRKIFILNVVTGIISAVFIILNNNEIRLIKWAVIVFLGLLYNSFFLENYIRKFPLLKVFYVGFLWALMNSWLSFPQLHLPVFCISLLFVTALVLPFDIRDKKSDDIITFPRLIGVQNTKYFAYCFTFLACILAILYLSPVFAVCFFLTTIFTFFIIYFSEENREDFYFSFWVESASGLPVLLYFAYLYMK